MPVASVNVEDQAVADAPNPGKVERIVRYSLTAVAGAYILLYLYTAFARLGFPFVLEWIEANSFVHVVRVLEGKPIYTPPSYDFVATIKTPLYFYISAGLARLGLPVMLSMRLVSILASLAAMGTLYAIGRARHLSWVASLVGVGLFVGAYRVAGFYFDIGRMDTLLLAWLLALLLVIVHENSQDFWSGLGAAALFTLAFATKQQATLVVPFWGLYLIIQGRWKKALAFWVGSAVLCSSYITLSSLLSHGWFWFFVFTVPGAAPLISEMWLGFWQVYVLPEYAWLIVFMALGMLARLWGWPAGGVVRYLLGLFLLVAPLVGMSYMTLLKIWGYLNGLIPLTAGFALLGAEACDGCLNRPLFRPVRRATLVGIGLVLLIGQFSVWYYSPHQQIPGPESLQAGNALLERLRQSPKPIYAANSPYLLYLIGQPVHFHTSALGDLAEASKSDPVAKAQYGAVRDQILAQIASAETAILPDAPWAYQMFSEETGYACQEFAEDQVLKAIVVAEYRLNRICFRQQSSP